MFRKVAIVLALLGETPISAAHAGPLVISPTTVEITPGRRSAVVEVENRDDTAIDLQLRAYAWDQPDGRDRLTPTNAIVLSPAIVTVPPGAKQLFRVIQTTVPKDGEQSYRLRLNQLPAGTKPGVAINYEFLIPLFVGGGTSPDRLSFSIDDGALRLANDGDRRIRIRDVTLRLQNGTEQPLPHARAAYILSKSSARWPLRRDVPTQGAQLVVLTDTGSIDVPPATVAFRR